MPKSSYPRRVLLVSANPLFREGLRKLYAERWGDKATIIGTPNAMADALLAHAVRLDENRPADDISVVIIKVARLAGDDVRRMSIRLPLSIRRNV